MNQASGFPCPDCGSTGPHWIHDYTQDAYRPLTLGLMCRCETSWWEPLDEPSD